MVELMLRGIERSYPVTNMPDHGCVKARAAEIGIGILISWLRIVSWLIQRINCGQRQRSIMIGSVSER